MGKRYSGCTPNSSIARVLTDTAAKCRGTASSLSLPASQAERHVQHGAILRRVDVCALPHGIDARAQANHVGELEELGERDLIEPLAREIHKESRVLARQALEAPGIALEELLHRHRREARGVGGEIR